MGGENPLTIREIMMPSDCRSDWASESAEICALVHPMSVF